MKIQILGSGCKKCKALYQNAELAIKKLGVDCHLEKVEDINQIIEFGVMITPALVVDNEVKTVGKVLSPEKISKLIT